jgi:hypothetical protein
MRLTFGWLERRQIKPFHGLEGGLRTVSKRLALTGTQAGSK